MDALIKATAFVAPVIVITLFVLPSYISLLKQQRLFGFFILVLLCAYSLGMMTLAVKTGVPYGEFSYDSALGYKLFGAVPWLVVVTYPSLLLAMFWMASKFTLSASRIILVALFSIFIGMMFDPVMVKLEFWQWDNPGPIYGVPLISFAGWLLTSVIGASLLHVLWKDNSVLHGIATSGIWLTLFWTGANIGIQQWIPAAIGGIVGGLMLLLAGIERWANRREGG